MHAPGNLTAFQVGLLSDGLEVRLVAQAGCTAVYDRHDGSTPAAHFHGKPDAGATFPDTRPNDPGGFMHASIPNWRPLMVESAH
jgi:hypothetical protein